MGLLRKLKEQENGSITLTVVAAMLFFVICITIGYFTIFNKTINQNVMIKRIEEEYSKSSSNEYIKQEYFDLLDEIDREIEIKLYKNSGEEYFLDDWTNEDLKLRVTWNVNLSDKYKYFYINDSKKNYVDDYLITENCTISVGYGKNKKVVNITKIDKTAPEYVIADDTEYNSDGTPKTVKTLIVNLGEKTSVSTGINATDNESGIEDNGIKCYKNNSEILTTDFFTQVGRYEVEYKIKDKAGNETTDVKRDILVRWPLAGKYVVARQNIAGEGMATGGQTNGLYKDTVETGLDSSLPFSSNYYFSGKTVNNNINFGGKTYNILNIAVNNDLKIIAEISGEKIGWENKQIYNSTIYNNWINTFAQERHLYNSSDSRNYIFTEGEWNHLDNATFYAGRFERNTNDTLANTINLERTSTYRLGGESAAFQSFVAFPNVSDYLKACNYLDTIYNIRSSQLNQSKFKDYNWLGSGEEQWTINSKRDDSSISAEDDFWIFNKTIIGYEMLSWGYNSIPQRQYRPVFYLKNNTILSGTGTSSDPFTVQENWAWFDSYQQKQ